MFLMYSKSMHGNKLNFIGWLQYLHIFVNEKIADKKDWRDEFNKQAKNSK